MSYANRKPDELDRHARAVHGEALAEAGFHDLGVITICFTEDGSFRVNAGPVNATLAVGLLQRAATELHLAKREQTAMQVVPVADIPRGGGGAGPLETPSGGGGGGGLRAGRVTVTTFPGGGGAAPGGGLPGGAAPGPTYGTGGNGQDAWASTDGRLVPRRE